MTDEQHTEHDTEIWTSAGGFYGWSCTCGTGGKGLATHAAAIVDSHRHLSGAAGLPVGREEHGGDSCEFVEQNLAAALDFLDRRDADLARVTQERDQARTNHATTQLNLELAQQSLTETREQRDNAKARIELARGALLRDGYFTDDQVGDDIAPRITERLAALNVAALAGAGPGWTSSDVARALLGSATPTPTETVQQRLDHLTTLEEGWDSYGAAPMQPGIRERVTALTDLLSEEPRIGLTSSGGGYLFWGVDEDVIIELEPDGTVTALIENRDLGEEPFTQPPPLHEVSCPACGTTIRARMAPTPTPGHQPRLHADTGTPLDRHACDGPNCCPDGPTEPAASSYQQVADAIQEQVLDPGLYRLDIRQDGQQVGLLQLARAMDRAGLINRQAFTEEEDR